MPILDSPVPILAGLHGDIKKMGNFINNYRHLNFILIDDHQKG
jgi:hypothetical protein